MSKSVKLWAGFDRRGNMLLWIGARATRKEVIAEAVQGVISATDYGRYTNDSDRWNLAYRQGCRIRRVTVTP